MSTGLYKYRLHLLVLPQSTLELPQWVVLPMTHLFDSFKETPMAHFRLPWARSCILLLWHQCFVTTYYCPNQQHPLLPSHHNFSPSRCELSLQMRVIFPLNIPIYVGIPWRVWYGLENSRTTTILMLSKSLDTHWEYACPLIYAICNGHSCTKNSGSIFNLPPHTFLYQCWLFLYWLRPCIEEGRATPSCSLHLGQRCTSGLVSAPLLWRYGSEVLPCPATNPSDVLQSARLTTITTSMFLRAGTAFIILVASLRSFKWATISLLRQGLLTFGLGWCSCPGHPSAKSQDQWVVL